MIKSKYNIIGNTPIPDISNSTVQYALIGAIFIGSDYSVWQKITTKFTQDINNWRLLNYLDFEFTINSSIITNNEVVTFESTESVPVTYNASTHTITFNLHILTNTGTPTSTPTDNLGDLWIYIDTSTPQLYYWYNNSWNTDISSHSIIDNSDGTYTYNNVTWDGTDDQVTSEIPIGISITNYPAITNVHEALTTILSNPRNIGIITRLNNTFVNKSANYKGSDNYTVVNSSNSNEIRYFKLGIYDVLSQSVVSSSATSGTLAITANVIPQNGDLIILTVICETSGVTIGTPSGFTLLDSYPTPWGISVFAKTANSETGTYTATFTPVAGYRYIQLHVLRSYAGNALVVDAISKNTDVNTTATSLNCQSLTSTKNYSYIYDSIILNNQARTYTQPTVCSVLTDNATAVYRAVFQNSIHQDSSVEQRIGTISTGGSDYKCISLCIVEDISNFKPTLFFTQTLPNGLYTINLTNTNISGVSNQTQLYFGMKRIIFVNCNNPDALINLPKLQDAFDYINNYDSANASSYMIVCSGTLGDTTTVTPTPQTTVVFLPNTTLNTGSNVALNLSHTTFFTYKFYGVDRNNCIITSSNSTNTIVGGSGTNTTDLFMSGMTVRNTGNGAAITFGTNASFDLKDCIITQNNLSKTVIDVTGTSNVTKYTIINCIINGSVFLAPLNVLKVIKNVTINAYNTTALILDGSASVFEDIVINISTDGTVRTHGLNYTNTNQSANALVRNIRIILTNTTGVDNSSYYNAPLVSALIYRNTITTQKTIFDNIMINAQGIAIISTTPNTNIKILNSTIKATYGFVYTNSTSALDPLSWTNAEIYNSLIDVDILGTITFNAGTPLNNHNILISG